MERGGADPQAMFLFVKAGLGFLVSAVLLFPLVYFREANLFLYFFVFNCFFLVFRFLKEADETLVLKISLCSGLFDILFFLLLAFQFRSYSQFFFLFLALIFAEAVLSLWLFSILIKNSFLGKRVKKQNEEAFSLLKEKLFEIKKQNKRIKELLKLKDEFLKIVNHQLRTPAAVISGLSEELAESGNQLAKKLRQASSRLTSILDDLLLAQTIKGNNVVIKPSSFDLAGLLEEALAKLSSLALEKKTKLVFKKPKEKIALFLDKELCFAAFLKVLENAVLYAKKSSIKVEIKMQKKLVQVSIKDKGIGFSSREKRSLFNPFYRSKQAVLQSPNGSGLGLYIAKNFLEKQGGALELSSKGNNKGCSALITLPL